MGEAEDNAVSALLTQLSSMGLQSTHSTEHLFMDKIITNDLIYDLIFLYASPASILRLSRTCRLCFAAVQSYLPRAYNINRHLSRFFQDPLAFRSLQARTGTVISGSNALQFFDRSFYPESDLDIYIPPRYKVEVGEWLLSVGYKFMPNTQQKPTFEEAAHDSNTEDEEYEPGSGRYSMRGVSRVFTFTKPSHVDPSQELKVQAIIASLTPMEIILLFHSTCVINAITWDKAYCFYPKGTLEDRRSLVCRANGPNQEEAQQKYAARGWDVSPELLTTGPDGSDPAFPIGPRYVGDRQTWTIPLNVTGVTPPAPITPLSKPLSTDAISCSGWRLHSYRPASNQTEMIFELVKGPSRLAFSYVFLPREAIKVSRMLEKQYNPTKPGGPNHQNEIRYFDEEVVQYCRFLYNARDPLWSW